MLRSLSRWVLVLGVLATGVLASGERNLPHGLSPEERAYIQDNFEEYIRSKRDVPGVRKPVDVMPAPGEFEPVEGIVVSWTQFTSTLTDLVREVTTHARAYVVVDGSWQERDARRRLAAAGVDLERVEFVDGDIDSVWVRDYGPNFVFTRDGDREIVDLVYNRPRYRDDKMPTWFGPALGVPVHRSPLILPGGNILFDGQGAVIVSDMVFDPHHGSDPDLTVEELEQSMADYFGVHEVIVLEQMRRDGTGHADMFCKLLNENTVIVGEYASPSDGAAGNYDILNRNAELLRNSVNGRGEPFRVVRIPMPPYQGGVSYTHTNSVMVNGKVIVPVYGKDTDEVALDIYRSLLPGFEVVGVDSNGPIYSNGALHCISHEVNGDPLVVEVSPPEAVRAGEEIELDVLVRSHQPLLPDAATIRWRLAGAGDFQVTPLEMESEVEGRYSVVLPGQDAGTRIEYLVRVEDVRGMYETAPEDATEEVTLSLTVAR